MGISKRGRDREKKRGKGRLEREYKSVFKSEKRKKRGYRGI